MPKSYPDRWTFEQDYPHTKGSMRPDPSVEEELGEKVLIVFVTAKRDESELAPDEILPDEVEIDGETYLVDVEEIGIPHGEHYTNTAEVETTPQDHRQRYRPIPGGVSIGNADVGAGTLGHSDFEHVESGDTVALTNSHVAPASRDQYQPASMDGGRERIPFGTLRESSTLDPNEVQTTDSALIDVSDDVVMGEILGLGELVGLGEARFRETHRKSGRTTGVTSGTLRGRDARVNVAYGPKTVRVIGCDVFSDMSRPGDSGSIITRQADDGAGLIAASLLFAGSDTATIGIPLSNVQAFHGELRVKSAEEPEPPEEPEPDEGDTGNGDGSDDGSDDSSDGGSDDGSDSDEPDEPDVPEEPAEPEPPEPPEPEPPEVPEEPDEPEEPTPPEEPDMPDEPEEPAEPIEPREEWGQFRHDAMVQGIVDGDTMDFETHHGPLNLRSDYRIRLLEIDTAERGRPDYSTHKGFVKQWFAEGVENYSAEDDPADPNEAYPFLLDTYRDELDAFGRLLTKVIRKSDGADLTEDLLAEYGETVRYDLEEQLESLLPGRGKGRPRSDD